MEVDLRKLVDPRNYTPNPHDYHLHWHLFQCLCPFDGLVKRMFPKICVNYASQLEIAGKWEWALFILLHLEGPARDKAIEEILCRHAPLIDAVPASHKKKPAFESKALSSLLWDQSTGLELCRRRAKAWYLFQYASMDKKPFKQPEPWETSFYDMPLFQNEYGMDALLRCFLDEQQTLGLPCLENELLNKVIASKLFPGIVLDLKNLEEVRKVATKDIQELFECALRIEPALKRQFYTYNENSTTNNQYQNPYGKRLKTMIQNPQECDKR
jgi:hypothetical protein